MPCEHKRVCYRDLLMGDPPKRYCRDCNELLPPLLTLEDRIARLELLGILLARVTLQGTGMLESLTLAEARELSDLAEKLRK